MSEGTGYYSDTTRLARVEATVEDLARLKPTIETMGREVTAVSTKLDMLISPQKELQDTINEHHADIQSLKLGVFGTAGNKDGLLNDVIELKSDRHSRDGGWAVLLKLVGISAAISGIIEAIRAFLTASGKH